MLDKVESEADAGNIDDSYTGGMDLESLSGVPLGAIESLRFSFEPARREDNDRSEILERPAGTLSGRALVVRVLFNGTQALALDNLAVTAEDVSPTDAVLLGRLPAGVVIPSEFAVLIHIDPGSSDEQGGCHSFVAPARDLRLRRGAGPVASQSGAVSRSSKSARHPRAAGTPGWCNRTLIPHQTRRNIHAVRDR